MPKLDLDVSRRSFLAMAAGGTAAVVLAACGTAATPVAEEKMEEAPKEEPKAAEEMKKEQVTVVAWNAAWGEPYSTIMGAYGPAFEADTGIKLDWQFIKDIEAKLIASIAAGSPPDTHYTNWVFQGPFMFNQIIRPLDEYMKAAGHTREEFTKAMWDDSSLNGQLYAVPGGADWIVYFWNKDMYIKFGEDPEVPLTDFNNTEEVSLKFHQTSGENISDLGWNYRSFGRTRLGFLFGGQFFDYDAGKVTPDDPAIIESLNWLVSLTKKQGGKVAVDEFFKDRGGYGATGFPWYTGNLAYFASGFWAQKRIDDNAPGLPYGIGLPPTVEGAEAGIRFNSVQGWMYAIPVNAANPDEAWAFDEWMFIDNSGKMGYETLNGPCVIAQLGEFKEGYIAKVGADNRIVPYVDVFLELAQYGETYWPPIATASDYRSAFMEASTQVLEESITAEEAMKTLATTQQAELDSAMSS
jgi:ABC-type glycerol-3-phosphate transport system substrate-binding protein